MKDDGHGAKIIETTEKANRDVGECWYIRPEPNDPGYYYIESCEDTGFRLAQWDWWMLYTFKSFGVRFGHRDDSMLFKLEQDGNYYRIFSKQFPDFKLNKNGKNDEDI